MISLSVLGDVIKFLGEGRGHVPYRNSMLTMVLKESLGGNSHTAIVANVSPSSNNYDETISTLKYADSAKRIRMRVAANVTSGLGAAESSTALQLVPLLQAEVAKLKELLKSQVNQNLSSGRIDYSVDAERATEEGDAVLEMRARVQELEQQLKDREDLIKSFADADTERDHRTTTDKNQDKRSFLQPLVLLSDDAVDTTVPRIVNLNQDPLFSECLVYYIPSGFATAGSDEAEVDIFLSGPDLLSKHCVFHNHRGVVTIGPLYSSSAEELIDGVGQIFVNGVDLRSAASAHDGHIVTLTHFDRVAIGRFHLFRFEAAGMHRSHSTSASPMKDRITSGSQMPTVPDWEFAQNELMKKSPNFSHSNSLPEFVVNPAPSGAVNHSKPALSQQPPSSKADSAPTKSILRNSDEHRRVRFSSELVLDKTHDYSRRPSYDQELEQEASVRVPLAENIVLENCHALQSEQDSGYWSRMDRIVKGTEKAANPAELRSMMRAALEMTNNEANAEGYRYSSGSSGLNYNGSTSSSGVAVPLYSTSPLKPPPPPPGPSSPPHPSITSDEPNTLMPPAKDLRKHRVDGPFKMPALAPVEVYTVSDIPVIKPKFDHADIFHNGEKFDNEVLALQSELAQMQKNLQDRMQRYRTLGKR